MHWIKSVPQSNHQTINLIAMQKDRIAYVDQIRVFLTCLVVAHHAGQAYGPTGGVWVVDNVAKAAWLGNFFFINASYMMGLYFFISGYFLVFSIKRKSNAAFTKDRLKKLGIPLLFFTLLVFLPFNYYGAGGHGNVFLFLIDTYVNKPPLATGHLWFVASLLVYSFIYLLLFHRWLVQKTGKFGSLKVVHLVIYLLLLTIVSALVRLKYPIDAWRTWLIPVEPAHLPQYFSLFIAGTMFNHATWLHQLTLKSGLAFFALAIITYLVNVQLPGVVKENWLMESFIESLLCIGISMGVLSLFRCYGNTMNYFVKRLSENVYGVYLFHLFIVIFLQQLMVHWFIGPNLKFFLVTLFGLILSFGLTALLRMSPLLRRII